MGLYPLLNSHQQIHFFTADICAHGTVRMEPLDPVGDQPVPPGGMTGTVQLCVDGVWTSVCGEEWSSLEAAVVCAELGYSQYGTEWAGQAGHSVVRAGCNTDILTTLWAGLYSQDWAQFMGKAGVQVPVVERQHKGTARY